MPIPRAFTDAIRAAAIEHPELEKALELLESEDFKLPELEEEPEPGGDWS
jgi:hypothetical protein